MDVKRIGNDFVFLNKKGRPIHRHTIKMIVDHYYRNVPAPDDGAKLEKAWNSTRAR